MAIPLNADVQHLLRAASLVARRGGETTVGPAHVRTALRLPPPHGATTPGDAGRGCRLGVSLSAALRRARAHARAGGAAAVAVEHLLAALGDSALERDGERRGGASTGAAAAAEARAGQGRSSDAPPVLSDLTARARAGGLPLGQAAAGRAEVERLVRLLAGQRRRWAVLLGSADMLPDTVVAALAVRLVRGDVPAPLAGTRLLALDTAALRAGGSGLAGVEPRLRAVLRELQDAADDPVVVVDHLPALAAQPGAAALLAAARGLRVVAVADEEGFRREVETDAALADRFAVLPLAEPDAAAATAFLQAAVGALERHHGVGVEEAAVRTAAQLSARHLPARALPGKAWDLLDEAAAAAAAEGLAAADSDRVARVLADQTGIPVARLHEGDLGFLRTLEQRLHERVVGQDQAVRALAAAVRRGRTGVGDPDRPLGSFLFLGPTGVGKTELARALAATLFADERALIRLDMGEYQEAHAVARLVGAPPGYVGYGSSGHLSEGLRRHPHSVVLLDEIEKAHDDVFNTLLSVLDEGRLTDGQGRTVDARSAVLIMTSNVGTAFLLDPDLSAGKARRQVDQALRDRFSPEFRNRVDEVVVFSRLTPPQLEAIVDLQLGRLGRRLAARGLSLRVPAQVRSWLAAHGSDPVLGARPLRRTIRRHVEDPIASALVAGDIREGQAVELTVEDGGARLGLRAGGAA